MMQLPIHVGHAHTIRVIRPIGQCPIPLELEGSLALTFLTRTMPRRQGRCLVEKE